VLPSACYERAHFHRHRAELWNVGSTYTDFTAFFKGEPNGRLHHGRLPDVRGSFMRLNCVSAHLKPNCLDAKQPNGSRGNGRGWVGV
jgi:hypothetical protein